MKHRFLLQIKLICLILLFFSTSTLILSLHSSAIASDKVSSETIIRPGSLLLCTVPQAENFSQGKLIPKTEEDKVKKQTFLLSADFFNNENTCMNDLEHLAQLIDWAHIKQNEINLHLNSPESTIGNKKLMLQGVGMTLFGASAYSLIKDSFDINQSYKTREGLREAVQKIFQDRLALQETLQELEFFLDNNASDKAKLLKFLQFRTRRLKLHESMLKINNLSQRSLQIHSEAYKELERFLQLKSQDWINNSQTQQMMSEEMQAAQHELRASELITKSLLQRLEGFHKGLTQTELSATENKIDDFQDLSSNSKASRLIQKKFHPEETSGLKTSGRIIGGAAGLALMLFDPLKLSYLMQAYGIDVSKHGPELADLQTINSFTFCRALKKGAQDEPEKQEAFLQQLGNNLSCVSFEQYRNPSEKTTNTSSSATGSHRPSHRSSRSADGRNSSGNTRGRP